MPLIVIVLLLNEAVTPAGKPVAVPIPVAPVVVCVIAVMAVFTHVVGDEEAAVTVLLGEIVILIVLAVPLPQVPLAFTLKVPLVAEAEKSMVTEFPVPFIVAPVPLYDHV